MTAHNLTKVPFLGSIIPVNVFLKLFLRFIFIGKSITEKERARSSIRWFAPQVAAMARAELI